MKKKFAIGLIALLSVSLFFFGCSTDDDGDDDKVTGETFTTIGSYPLKDGQTGLSSTAKRSNSTGIVYIKVTGEVDANPTTTFGTKGPSAPAGKWSQIEFDLSAACDDGDKYYAIKNTNDAFRYYTGATHDFITTSSAPTAPVKRPPDTNPDVYIPTTGNAFKWKIYDTVGGNSNASLFEVLVWSSANPKIITLEIREYEDYTTYDPDTSTYTAVETIVIDYSAITYGSGVLTIPNP
jgi:hypothetical protein